MHRHLEEGSTAAQAVKLGTLCL